MSHWTDWEFGERELMECANATIFRDRPDLQFKFDGSAPPLLTAIATEAGTAETPQSGSVHEGAGRRHCPNNSANQSAQEARHG